MATLLPSIDSDDDEEFHKAAAAANHITDDDDEDDEKDEGGGKMDSSFEFGGILGEDGGDGMNHFSTTNKSSSGVGGWNFQSALQSISSEKGSKAAALAAAHPRMDISSLIAAKRKVIRQEKQQQQSKKEDEEEEEDPTAEESDNSSSSDDEDEEGSGNGDGNKEGDDDDNDSSSSGSSSDSDSDSDSDDEDDDHEKDAAHEMEQDILKTKAGEEEEEDDDNKEEEDSSDDDEEDAEEAAKAAKFFDSQSTGQTTQKVELFVQLTLSRPLLRGVAAMGFVRPTPIQASCIPAALSGRDICASAVTGSGKTAAFSLPILERLLHRTSGSSRAIILTPTRELAAQCLGMISSLAQFTQLRAALVVGGSKNITAQAAELRTKPDIIVATPGRLLDHVTNSAGFELSDLEFLVLDEADRLLDLGFQDEVMEIVKACPVQRQTLLFSATMNTKVDDLIKLSLKRPVRIRVSDKNTAGSSNNASSFSSASGGGSNDIEVAPHLEQEFIRIRSGNEGINREAILLALLTRTFTTQIIVFFDTKAIAHRIMILCGLCGIQCAELHGNLTQAQRLTALESFRQGEVNVLLATDLAGRGIDIPNVETVVNFEMPSQVSSYIHRIGRTARAGRGGRSCTLIGEGRRHLMKSVIKDAEEKKKQRKNDKKSGTSKFQTGTIRSRSIPAAVVAHFVAKIQSLEPHLKEVMQAETVARLDRLADMEATKAQNLIEHSAEIMARPQREWFASNKQKKMTKEEAREKMARIREAAGTGTHRMTRKKRRGREAREAVAAAFDNDDDDAETERRPRVDPEQIMKSAAKAAKRKEQKRERDMASQSINSMSGSSRKKRKTSGDAVGDSSLFGEEKVAHSSKKQTQAAEESRAKSSYNFRDADFDDTRRKKSKKKSVNSFKSKSKYKRRK